MGIGRILSHVIRVFILDRTETFTGWTRLGVISRVERLALPVRPHAAGKPPRAGTENGTRPDVFDPQIGTNRPIRFGPRQCDLG